MGHVENLVENLSIGKLKHPSEYLSIFWAYIPEDRTTRLKMIKAMAAIKFDLLPYRYRQVRRGRFNNRRDNGGSSWMKIDDKICFLCEKEPHHRHHLIQIQYGGQNTRKNIVHLCRSCHKEVHR